MWFVLNLTQGEKGKQPCSIYGQTRRAIYTKQEPNNKHRDVACDESCSLYSSYDIGGRFIDTAERALSMQGYTYSQALSSSPGSPYILTA